MTEKLLPCPFCGCNMRLSAVARDWWRVAGGHNEDCILYDQRHDAPQTDYQKKALIDDWNRRAAQPAASAEKSSAIKALEHIAGFAGTRSLKTIKQIREYAKYNANFAAPVAAQPSVRVSRLSTREAEKLKAGVSQFATSEDRVSALSLIVALAAAPTPPADGQVKAGSTHKLIVPPWWEGSDAEYEAAVMRGEIHGVHYAVAQQDADKVDAVDAALVLSRFLIAHETGQPVTLELADEARSVLRGVLIAAKAKQRGGQ